VETRQDDELRYRNAGIVAVEDGGVHAPKAPGVRVFEP